MSNPRIRVLAVDDQRVVREGLAMLLGLLPDVEVVGTAADGEEVLAMAAELRPDVILMDLRMPRVDGVEATRRLRERDPEVKVVVLTTYADDRSVLDALRAGALGYLTKDAGAAEIQQALHRVASGQAALDPAVQRDDGVVDGAGELAVAHQAGVRERVAAGPVHLRGAAQRVGVLHAGAVPGAVAGHDGRPGQQRAQVGGAVRLAGVRAQRLQVRGEHRVGAELGLDTHGGGKVSRPEEQREVTGGERQHAEHAVDAVGEGQTLLLAQDDRRDPRRGERVGGGPHVVADAHGTLAHRGEGAVGQRSEIA